MAPRNLSVRSRIKNKISQGKAFGRKAYKMTSARKAALMKAVKASAEKRKKQAGSIVKNANTRGRLAMSRGRQAVKKTTRKVSRSIKRATSNRNTKMLRAKLKVTRGAKTVRNAARAGVAVAKKRGRKAFNRAGGNTKVMRAKKAVSNTFRSTGSRSASASNTARLSRQGAAAKGRSATRQSNIRTASLRTQKSSTYQAQGQRAKSLAPASQAASRSRNLTAQGAAARPGMGSKNGLKPIANVGRRKTSYDGGRRNRINNLMRRK